MSDPISKLPLNKYSNPTNEEIEIIESLFDNNDFDFKQLKFVIIICFIHIISCLIQDKYKINNVKFLIFSTTSILLFSYVSYTYII